MPECLGTFLLHLADTSLIMGHRLSEWSGHGPMLEQDIALSNIALDYIGQARNFYQYAATLGNDNADGATKIKNSDSKQPVTEDTLAYLRDARDYRNLLITEIANGDWGKTILKLYFVSNFLYMLYEKLVGSKEKQLAAIAEKSLKELKYHKRWSSEWVIRLGDGTAESHKRMDQAVEDLWPYTGEMFDASSFEKECMTQGVVIDVSQLKDSWHITVKHVFDEATLTMPPAENRWIKTGGKEGLHTEQLGFLLAEMQYLQRAYPGCEW